ncbi:class I SAM-dependent methyltransferase [Bacillus sp. 03113]|uniref:class I SAM-dependent methyltransferase n=1 Tax=Bacillus sp. 03113 TaxID=2578211 RepID=UPI0011430851|nr:class I SAM-dependent methyltransferase [Bacillus sp. 03113]
MADHYYSRTQQVDSNPSYWDFVLKGTSFRFKTDNGVFSKKEVDFGSRLLVEAFEAPDIKGDFLDVGCGYGPIGISIAKHNQDRIVHMVDINLRALELAKDNAKNNRVQNIQIYESDRLESIDGHKFAAIMTNPPIRAGKKVVHDIFEQSFECLKEDGELWVVIQKKQGAPSAIEKLSTLFHSVETVEKKKGYFILKAIKR